jgi:hypothetical protein
MFCNSFARSLLFAAVAAVGLWVAAAVLLPVLHPARLLTLYVAAAAAAYIVGIAPGRSAGLAAGGIAAALGCGLLLLPLGVAGTALAAALVIAVCRSAILYRARRLRALLLEGVLLVGGLGLAHAFAGSGSAALGLWGYFLVQSAFFLVGGVAARGERDGGLDPFDRACAQLAALLDAP